MKISCLHENYQNDRKHVMHRVVTILCPPTACLLRKLPSKVRNCCFLAVRQWYGNLLLPHPFPNAPLSFRSTVAHSLWTMLAGISLRETPKGLCTSTKATNPSEPTAYSLRFLQYGNQHQYFPMLHIPYYCKGYVYQYQRKYTAVSHASANH